MNILEIIDKKRVGEALTKEEIAYSVNGFLDGMIKDYQMSSLLMAITINGMTDEETIFLTDVMLKSGDILDTSLISGTIVDKHSTGGIGDKVTLVLCPLLASFGIKIAKMSGRGLGFTGGTIDKLESIPHFQVELTEEQFIKQVNEIGIAISSPNLNLDKADKQIYALRDVTSTVSSIPLIASSIMSKKLACNADIIIIDVKVGNGALMKDLDSAKALARLLCKIGKHYQKKVICLLTSMYQPLGFAIGNALEVKESMMALQGSGPADLLELIIFLSAIILNLVQNIPMEEAKNLVFKQLNNGKAYDKFQQLVTYQGGNIAALPVSDNVISIVSVKEGYINQIDSAKLGYLTNVLGAGKLSKDDTIDYGVGIVLTKKLGDYINKGEELLRLYVGEKQIEIKEVLDCFTIEKEAKELCPLIYGLVK